MSQPRVIASGKIGKGFIPQQFIPPGKDEYYIRNEQSGRPVSHWRKLTADEIAALERNGNTAETWDDVLVAEGFQSTAVKNCQFHGLVRLGKLAGGSLEHEELRLPVGLSSSRIVSCDIGDNAAIHDVKYMAHTIVGDGAILFNVGEISTSENAAFGNGIVKDGQEQATRTWINVINENGERGIAAFDGQTAADAFLWAKYRDDRQLMDRLMEVTQKTFDARRGYYSTIGQGCVLVNCGLLKDVRIGQSAHVIGAGKLENVTINSSDDEPTEIGEGVELVDGVVGRGCRMISGARAMRFVLADGASLALGARLVHTYLGDNSAVSCCEVQNSLIFPAHQQHHNNSFLIASLVMGQSNIAAGATIGSNHNSRSPDGEVQAGRGFWPGLCVSLKHNCRFASYVLLAKGDYPCELDILLPFSLVSNDSVGDKLQVMPAYWWLYNMYALARNNWKYRARDRRAQPAQHIEYDALAPDTAEEIFNALGMLEKWVAKAHLAKGSKKADIGEDELRQLGRKLLTGPAKAVDDLEVVGDELENSRRKAVILRAYAAYHAYRQMLHHYAMTNLLAYMRNHPKATANSMSAELAGPRQKKWINLGGQLVLWGDLERIKSDIKSGPLPPGRRYTPPSIGCGRNIRRTSSATPARRCSI